MDKMFILMINFLRLTIYESLIFPLGDYGFVIENNEDGTFNGVI